MSQAAKLVPGWVRIVTLLLALANVAFGVVGYLRVDALFPDLSGAPGLAADAPLLMHASREFSARNLAIGLALLIVSRVGVPESIAIVTIIRALVELQTIIITVVEGKLGAGTAVAAGFLVVEVLVIRRMFSLVAERDRAST
jgi:hypothetical protein